MGGQREDGEDFGGPWSSRLTFKVKLSGVAGRLGALKRHLELGDGPGHPAGGSLQGLWNDRHGHEVDGLELFRDVLPLEAGDLRSEGRIQDDPRHKYQLSFNL